MKAVASGMTGGPKIALPADVSITSDVGIGPIPGGFGIKVDMRISIPGMDKAAAQALVGHHDFTTFRDLGCQAKSPMKTLDLASVRREGEQVLLDFASRSFLHRQVRSMTGSLVQVGAGRWSAADLKAALEARDRRACGPVAPADGLYLTFVGYEED